MRNEKKEKKKKLAWVCFVASAGFPLIHTAASSFIVAAVFFLISATVNL
jgi:hypothetical protein